MAAAVLMSCLLGAVCLGIGLWGVQHPPGEMAPILYRTMPPEYGFIAGPIFLGFGIYELFHRLRTGPQPPGRHARPPGEK